VGCFFPAAASGCVGSFPAPRDFAVAQIRSDGLLDPSFSGDGVQEIGFGSSESDDRAAAVIHPPDGGLVIGGFAGNDEQQDFALARLEPSGDLDNGFSADGRATIAFPDQTLNFLNDLALSQGGDIVAVGGGYSQKLAVARLRADGSPDPAFSGDGKDALDLGLVGVGEGPSGQAVAIQGDGRILIGGVSSYLAPGGGPDRPLLVRLEEDGDVDPSFPVLTHLPVPDVADVAVQPTGILGVGSSNQFSQLTDFVLFGRQVDGATDRSFPRPDGSVATNFDGREDEANALSVQGDGRVLVAGTVTTESESGEGVVGVARYLMGAGRRDQDADGIRDKPDRCPKGYSKRRRGCPRSKDDGTVSLDISDNRRFVFGSLSSNYLECMDRRRVLTLKLRPGKDRVTRSTKAEYHVDSEEGGFSHNIRNLNPGRYYARAPRSVEAVGICRALRSEVVRIHK
jgi:uncharacterized delta-60 repeat protein